MFSLVELTPMVNEVILLSSAKLVLAVCYDSLVYLFTFTLVRMCCLRWLGWLCLLKLLTPVDLSWLARNIVSFGKVGISRFNEVEMKFFVVGLRSYVGRMVIFWLVHFPTLYNDVSLFFSRSHLSGGQIFTSYTGYAWYTPEIYKYSYYSFPN